MTIILSNLNRFKRFFSLKNSLVNLLLKLPLHLAYVAILHCEILVSTKQAINDKLQGNVATYLGWDEVVNNQIKKGLLLSLWVIF